MNHIYAIIILYKPDYEILNRSLASLQPQVDKIIIIDNTPRQNLSKLFEDNSIIYVALGKNVGIASAQNYGLATAHSLGGEFIFFLDQDSIVEPNLVSQLLSTYINLEKNRVVVGAVGPRPINREFHTEYRGSIKKGKTYTSDITEVTELISSASLIRLSNFDNVGLMDSSLFIDGVDHEWCWRCSKEIGGRMFIDEKCHLSHKLGEGDRRFLLRKVAIPTPFRTYYQFRNYLLLLRRGYVPLYWKASNGLKYLVKAFYYPVFIAPRKSYLRNILKGLKDGILGKSSNPTIPHYIASIGKEGKE